MKVSELNSHIKKLNEELENLKKEKDPHLTNDIKKLEEELNENRGN